MLKLLRALSPLTSSKLYTAWRRCERSATQAHDVRSPFAEKSDAPSGILRYEKPAEFAPSVAVVSVRTVSAMHALCPNAGLTVEEVLEQAPVVARVLALHMRRCQVSMAAAFGTA